MELNAFEVLNTMPGMWETAPKRQPLLLGGPCVRYPLGR